MTGRAASGGRPRTLRIDPHVHTSASYDGVTPPADLVRRACAVGLDGIVVTNSGLASMLVIGTAVGLSGIAEFLPKDRRHLAGALRVAAIGILVLLVLRSTWRIIT
ncbi:PHP domain-containing protein [Natrinema sp. 1APR25-10V2]|uniref:PHP domain-containing protein n=1 Tax=Natrinema sp. 1APR25-10V2 TaxID=2951081 RepID=UPI002876E682|nr:PHP domain-containing protein [Natrinema sp. 1APR25-10V2]MDS0475204.1 PHP domain-containing protein [Natrinema sp. 1APR25-10V2]